MFQVCTIQTSKPASFKQQHCTPKTFHSRSLKLQRSDPQGIEFFLCCSITPLWLRISFKPSHLLVVPVAFLYIWWLHRTTAITPSIQLSVQSNPHTVLLFLAVFSCSRLLHVLISSSTLSLKYTINLLLSPQLLAPQKTLLPSNALHHPMLPELHLYTCCLLIESSSICSHPFLQTLLIRSSPQAFNAFPRQSHLQIVT